jgi:hypothetical protein
MAHILECKSQSFKDEKMKEPLKLEISKEIFEIITSWDDDLSDSVQTGILAMIRSIGKGKTSTGM